jgi:hypothetical protein
MPGIMSQTRAVEAKVQAISPDWYCEPITGAGVSVAFMAEGVVVSERE